MERTGLISQGSTEGLRKERAEAVSRHSLPAEASVAQRDDLSFQETPGDEYVIELDVAAGFLWWWSLFDVIELEGRGTDGLAARSVAPAAAAKIPRLSRRAALRAGKHAARGLSGPAGDFADRAGPSARLERLSRRPVRSALVVLAAAVVAGLFLGLDWSHATNPRTEVLRSESPLSDIWIRITGPGGAVSYVGHRFLTAGAFRRFTLSRDPAGGVLMPPVIRGQKLCAATHVIQPGDASQLQKWQGRKLAITIYGKKASAIYCAVLGYGLYLG